MSVTVTSLGKPNPTSSTQSRLCSMCNEPGTSHCCQCKSSLYCSGECRDADWPIHKTLCKSLQDFMIPPPSRCDVCSQPSVKGCENCSSRFYCSSQCANADFTIHSSHCGAFANILSHLPEKRTSNWSRSILFPEGEKNPRFVWVECPVTPHGYEMAKLDDLDRLNNGSVDSNLVFKNAVLGRALGYIIMMYYRSKFLTDGSKRNQSISTVTRGSTVKTHDWRGPMLFMKNIGPASDMERFGDMTLSDLRDIVDWLCQYTGEGSNKSVEWKNNAVMLRDDNDLSVNPSTAPIKTHGVRLNCLGDQTISKLPQSTSVSIPPRHPIQNNNTATCAIATLIGLPLRVWRYRPNKAWAKNGPSDAYANPAVGLLSLSLDINHHDDWLKTPTAWQDTGSVLVVRADGKPLLPEHLEALCFWIENHVFHALAKIAEEDKVTENWKKKREVALREVVRKEKFEEVWVGFVNAKVHRGESIWKEVSNPYDTKLRNGT